MPIRLQDWIQAKKASQTHRQLIVISGPEAWTIESIITLSEEWDFSNFLSVGIKVESPDMLPGISVTNSHYRQCLGQEFDGVIYNAYRGFRANAVMALSGTIKREGLMFLLCPDLDNWAYFNDPEREKRTSFGFERSFLSSAFVKHLVTNIKQTDDVVLLTPEQFKGKLALSPVRPGSNLDLDRTPSQERAIQKIIKVATGHRKRPLVIDADRGRGKSSVLGMAAAELLKGSCKNIIITAPNASACQQVFVHAKNNWPESGGDNMVLKIKDKQLRFIPPDALLSTQPNADLLLIDEAAAIPTPLLKQLLSLSSRIVFSTTVDGYEGSGRGFEIRFKKHLDAHTPDWHSLHLSEPVRWDKGDPLERFWFNTLLMKEASSRAHELAVTSQHALNFTVFQGKEITAQPGLLSSLFSLMINAHYQTVPDDLQRMLDSPDHSVLVARQRKELIGAILFVDEPAYLGDLTDDIHRGKRRVNGHLLSQSLCFHCGFREATALTYIRTVRIAVNPSLQQQ
ncbi:MAG: GNAT family N-acetyltransferase, partial [Pseudomonadota bacterium]